ncbi:MAG: zinc ribbon domain-containing protein [Candidatus Rokuibacteriota bacterium]
MAVTCPSCGAPARLGVRFCEECGQRLPAACPSCGSVARAVRAWREHRPMPRTGDRQPRATPRRAATRPPISPIGS